MKNNPKKKNTISQSKSFKVNNSSRNSRLNSESIYTSSGDEIQKSSN